MNARATARRPVRMSIEHILESARAHPARIDELDLAGPVDRSRDFVCPTVTPLYYTSIYRELDEAQRRRSNQLTGMAFNELIAFFEGSGLAALERLARRASLPEALAASLGHFAAEERRHIDMWHRLDELSRTSGDSSSPTRFVGRGFAMQHLVPAACRRPALLPVLAWIMLLQEERAIDVARRCSAAPGLEPRYAAAYRLHMADEARHVQIDWHLIELLHGRSSPARRRLNAWLVRAAVRSFLLAPRRLAVAVMTALLREFPELAPLRARAVSELAGLARNPEYQSMMYSRRSHPISFALFDRYPELHSMRHVFACYEPEEVGR